MVNKEYVQLLVPTDSSLSYANGGSARKISPPISYAAQGFKKDPDVVAIEKTRKEYPGIPSVTGFTYGDRNIFATWATTEPGKKTELTFDYVRNASSFSTGSTFEFVFEKQSGSMGSYSFQFAAPVGYKFRENGLPTFEYKSDDPPGRLTLELTLEKI